MCEGAVRDVRWGAGRAPVEVVVNLCWGDQRGVHRHDEAAGLVWRLNQVVVDRVGLLTIVADLQKFQAEDIVVNQDVVENLIAISAVQHNAAHDGVLNEVALHDRVMCEIVKIDAPARLGAAGVGNRVEADGGAERGGVGT